MTTPNTNLVYLAGVARNWEVAMADSAAAATDLRAALAELDLSRTYQTDGEGMSTVSVWNNLTVWCVGGVFFWRSGHDFAELAVHPVDDPPGAAVKIKARYKDLRDRCDVLPFTAREETGR